MCIRDREKEQRRLVEGSFLSEKPLIITVNVDEGELKESLYPGREKMLSFAAARGVPLIEICAQMEMEINRLPEEERGLFMADLGLNISGISRLARAAYDPVSYTHLDVYKRQNYPSPRRTSAGIDLNRVALIMAVLEKHAGVSFVGLDTFVNVVGGVRLLETAVDLALAISLVSSLKGKSLSEDILIVGEVGLTGEIRPVSRIRQRLNEGVKLGFKRFVLPQLNLEDLEQGQRVPSGLQLAGVETIREAISAALSGK